MATTKKVIKVPQGVVPKLSKIYGIGRSSVYDALGFRTDSVIARKIRKDALEVYGGFVGKSFYQPIKI